METSSNIEIAEEMMSVAKVTRFTFAALIFVYQAAPAEKRKTESRACLAGKERRKAESMEKEAFIELVEANPVVAAIKDDDGLKRCLESDINVVFVLYGDVISIREIVHRLKKGNKTVLVHVDLISGLAPKEVSVDFIRKYTEADGIITTRRNLTEYAKSLGMNTVLRYFMIDSLVLENIKKQSKAEIQPDIIEILPAILVPDFIERIRKICKAPLMASGLVTSKQETLHALNAGAIAVSTTNQTIWFS